MGGSHAGRRYAVVSMIAAGTGILGLFDPVVTSLLVSRVMKHAPVERVGPVFATLLALKGTRIYARVTMTRMLGGNQRAPLNWLRRRVGDLIWWLEPLLNNWGPVGVLMGKLAGPSGISRQIASGLIFLLTDLSDSFLAGSIYYLTQSYLLSFCSAMLLPTLFVIPWYTGKTRDKARSRADAAPTTTATGMKKTARRPCRRGQDK